MHLLNVGQKRQVRMGEGAWEGDAHIAESLVECPDGFVTDCRAELDHKRFFHLSDLDSEDETFPTLTP